MKLATLKYKNTELTAVITPSDDAFIPLDSGSVKSMQYLIENYDVLRQYLLRKSSDSGSAIPLKEAVILAPIPYPKRNIICLGKNYLEHVKEIKGITGGPKDTAPEYAIYFTKSAYPCNHHEGIIKRHPGITEKIDYEVELTIVIGKTGFQIPKDKAFDYVFGYTIGNDISARDVQNRHVNWFMGKSLDSHCPVGPWIVTKDDIPNPRNLKISSTVNDEIRQKGNTSDMIRDIPQIIHEISQGYTLFPGDMIMTGTPKGVGMGFNPPRYLKAGDTVSCKIENIGTLTNYIEK